MRIKIIFFSLIIFVAGCSTLPKAIIPIKKKQTCTAGHEIYIISHGWHAGLAIKAGDLNKVTPDLAVRFPDSMYYEIGWGDTGFYQANKITTGLTFQAMFWSSGSVLHIVGLEVSPLENFKNSKVEILTSDDENYQNLLNFINSSFQRDKNNKIILESKGIYGDSQFYTGIGKYHILNTCNKWTAKALYSAGYNISPMFKLTSSSVMGTLQKACKN